MKYVETFLVSKVVFSWLLHVCPVRLEFETTNMRCSISPEKRLAILLHSLRHGFAERQLATLYRVGPAIVIGILHSSVEAVMTRLVPISIRFPVGQALHDQMLRRSTWLTILRWCCRWSVYAHLKAGAFGRPVLVL